MRKLLLVAGIVLYSITSFSQGANITSWQLNANGHKAKYYNSDMSIVQLTDSSDVLEVCYNNDTVYVKSNNLASYMMGPWPGSPHTIAAKEQSYVFPRNPVYPSTTHANAPTGTIGVLINGVLIYSPGDGKSYKVSTGKNETSGDGLWNALAWTAHGGEFDDNGGAHPAPGGVYHVHCNPYGLYDSTNKTSHSPIIGFAFDGYPIYGPYGYSTATNSSSAIKRMEVSYQLKNISSRTSGPTLAAYALGYYIEDYEYVSGSGDLDEYNGRYCVTPEYPAGTYAYFLGTNADGSPTYPNIIASKFYGNKNFPVNQGPSGGSAGKPKKSVTCFTPATSCDISPSATVTNVSCYSGSNGAVDLSATGGAGSYTYEWEHGPTTQDLSGVAAGTYTVSVSDGQCSVELDVTVTQPSAALALTSSATTVNCTNALSGSIDLTVTGGTLPYSYVWRNDLAAIVSNNQDLSNLAQGTYSVVVTDSKNCSTNASVPVSAAPPIVLSATATAACSGQATGSITLTVSGGTANFSYLWSNGATTQDLNSLAAGTYSVTVTDSKGCANTLEIIVTESTAIQITSSVTDAMCSGASTGAINITVTGGTSPYTYLWSTSSTMEDLSALGADDYTVTVTDSKNCSKTLTVSILEPTTINGTLTVTHAGTGNDGAINLAVTGGVAPYAFNWNNGAQTEDLTSLEAGTYTVTITDNNGCMKTLSAIVNSLVITDVEEQSSLSAEVYPNPNNGSFVLKLVSSKIRTYAVYDLMGRKVLSGEVSLGEQRIDINSGKGIYLLYLIGDKTAYKRKIIVQDTE
jgi:hypothetical protein